MPKPQYRVILPVGAIALAGCMKAAPETEDPKMETHASITAGGDPERVSAAAFNDPVQRMHRDRGTASDNPDETFMRMMIPHHQGAIDMAEIVLEHGTDEETRAFAARSSKARVPRPDKWKPGSSNMKDRPIRT